MQILIIAGFSLFAERNVFRNCVCCIFLVGVIVMHSGILLVFLQQLKSSVFNLLLHRSYFKWLVYCDIGFDVLFAICCRLLMTALTVVLGYYRFFALDVPRRRFNKWPASGQLLHIHVCAVFPNRAFVLARVADGHWSLFTRPFNRMLMVFVRMSIGLERMLLNDFLSELFFVLDVMRLDWIVEWFPMLLRLHFQSARWRRP